MFGRSPDDSTEQGLLLREWRYLIAGQAVVVLLMLPMLRVQRGVNVAAVLFSLVALANTIRIPRSRDRARTAGRVPPTTRRDLSTVAAGIVGTAMWALAVAVWGR